MIVTSYVWNRVVTMYIQRAHVEKSRVWEQMSRNSCMRLEDFIIAVVSLWYNFARLAVDYYLNVRNSKFFEVYFLTNGSSWNISHDMILSLNILLFLKCLHVRQYTKYAHKRTFSIVSDRLLQIYLILLSLKNMSLFFIYFIINFLSYFLFY